MNLTISFPNKLWTKYHAWTLTPFHKHQLLLFVPVRDIKYKFFWNQVILLKKSWRLYIHVPIILCNIYSSAVNVWSTYLHEFQYYRSVHGHYRLPLPCLQVPLQYRVEKLISLFSVMLQWHPVCGIPKPTIILPLDKLCWNQPLGKA